MKNLENLRKRFKELKENFIECEALRHGNHVYIVAKNRQAKNPREKRWFLLIRLSGEIRGVIFQLTPKLSYKEILLTSNNACQYTKQIVSDFFFVKNVYYDAHKRLLFDQETNTVFSYKFGRLEEKVLCQIFEVKSEN